MFLRPFSPASFLRHVHGHAALQDYCQSRRIPFEAMTSRAFGKEDLRKWAEALATLPPEEQARIELELAMVNELSDRDAVAHLIEAAGPQNVPPDQVASGTPLALWFLVRDEELFREVFFRHEIREVQCWRVGQAPPGLPLGGIEQRAASLAALLRDFFRLHEGTGRFCAVEAKRLPDAVCFIAQVADRLRFLEGFSDSGRPTLQRLRPAMSVLFVYEPAGGTVLLQSHLRAAERVRALLWCFGQAVLSSPVEGTGEFFNLEPLKFPFHPLPDAADMEMVRVKSLHLQYPGRAGRRQLKLETRAGDEPAAIEQMLRAHVAGDQLTTLRVSHAELQIRVAVQGGSKNYSVRLWPDRSSLSHTPLGDRFRRCLRRWGLNHASER